MAANILRDIAPLWLQTYFHITALNKINNSGVPDCCGKAGFMWLLNRPQLNLTKHPVTRLWLVSKTVLWKYSYNYIIHSVWLWIIDNGYQHTPNHAYFVGALKPYLVSLASTMWSELSNDYLYSKTNRLKKTFDVFDMKIFPRMNGSVEMCVIKLQADLVLPINQKANVHHTYFVEYISYASGINWVILVWGMTTWII